MVNIIHSSRGHKRIQFNGTTVKPENKGNFDSTIYIIVKKTQEFCIFRRHEKCLVLTGR
jgi:hypothetical protein